MKSEEERDGRNYQILGVICSQKDRGPKTLSNFFGFRWSTPYDFTSNEITNFPIDEARNLAVETAINENFEYILFLDTDIFVRSTFLMEMMKRFELYSPDTVVANYFLKEDYPAPVTRIVNTKNNYALSWTEIQTKTENELNSPDYRFVMSGAGALLINTELLKKMEKPYFQYLTIDDGRKMGEDTYFFRKVNDMGAMIWVAWDIPVAHVDEKDDKWYGRPEDIELIRKDREIFRSDVSYEEWPPKFE